MPHILKEVIGPRYILRHTAHLGTTSNTSPFHFIRIGHLQRDEFARRNFGSRSPLENRMDGVSVSRCECKRKLGQPFYLVRNSFRTYEQICPYKKTHHLYIGRDISLQLLIYHHEHFLPLYFLRHLRWHIHRLHSQFYFLVSTHSIMHAVNPFHGL